MRPLNEDVELVDVPGAVVGDLEGVGQLGPDVGHDAHGGLRPHEAAVPDLIWL